MSLWQQAQRWIIRRTLRTDRQAVIDVLRQDPALAIQAVEGVFQDLHGGSGGQRKTTEWPVLNQVTTGGRNPLTANLPKVTPFNLRRFSEYPPARRAINALTNPILELPWVIEPCADAQHTMQKPEDLDPHTQWRIKTATKMLQRPNPSDSWRVLLEQTLEDIIVGGYGAIEVARSGDPERPCVLYPVDGQSIRINAHWNHDPLTYRYSQSLGYVGISIGTHDIVSLYDDELLYFRLNPRTNTPFGLGYLETAFMIVNAWLGAFEYAERRASNATPNFGIFLGEHVDIPTARRWQQYWEQEIEGYGKVPILGGGQKPEAFHLTGTGEDQLYLKWQDVLVRVIAMSFGLSPMRLGMERDVNRSTAEVQSQDDWETIAPVAGTVQDMLTHKLIGDILGWQDLQFRWLVRDTNELRQAQIYRERYEMESLTVNEVRALYQLPPLANALGDLTKSAYEAAVQAQATPRLPAFGGEPEVTNEPFPWASGWETAPASTRS